MNQVFSNFTRLIQQYSLRQRLLVITVLIGIVSSIIALLIWANRPEYELLYSDLDPATASTIVSELRDNNIKYRLKNGGTTIYIPYQHVAEMRLKFAQAGYLKSGISGYEIFEKSNIGMTTFMQKLNLRRALEGELSRTINQFPEVSQSRVHLAIPESRLFEKDKKGSASVVLYLKPGAKLTATQLNGMAALVANSVEEIETSDVVVLDSNGNVLVDGSKDSGAIGSVTNQWQLQNTVESELRRKVTQIVEGVVGHGNSVVEVSVDMNFDQIERTIEAVDPDNVAVLSEESYSETSSDPAANSNFRVERITSNYELSKKLERFVSNAGNIKKITVAVLVNGRYVEEADESGERIAKYVARSDQELQQIAALVKSAVGFSEARGDIVEVQNIKFSKDSYATEQEYFEEHQKRELWEKLIKYGLLGIGSLVGFLLTRRLLNSDIQQLFLPLSKPVPALEGGQEQVDYTVSDGETSEDIYTRKLSPEANAKLSESDRMTQSIGEFVEKSPEHATRLLESWISGEHEG